MSGLKVAVLINLKKNAPKFPGMAADHWDDLDLESTAHALVSAIEAGGHTCVYHEGNAELYDKLRADRPYLRFYIRQGHFGDGREAQVPAMLEMLRLPYTGSRVLALALALDKPLTKRVLMWHGLPTPAFQTFERADEPLDDDMLFPLFVKPSREGTGMGVSAKSIVRTEAELRERLDHTINRYQQTALVERFIAGEVTVGLVGNVSGIAVFIYTLPSSALGEAAIHFGLTGPLLYAAGVDGTLGEPLAMAAGIVVAREAGRMLVGRIAAEEALYAIIDGEQKEGALCTLDEAQLILESTEDISDIIRKLYILKVKKGTA